MLNAKSKNVSVIEFTRRKLQVLKMKLVRNPNARPIKRLTKPSIANWRTISNGMYQVKVAAYS